MPPRCHSPSAGPELHRRSAARLSAWALAALAAAWLTGCASLPDTQFLRKQYVAHSAEFKNAWGPIPARTSAAIVAELKAKAGNLDILDRQIAIEQAVVGHPLVLGNSVKLLLDGPATYAAMFAAMRGAHSSINVESYIVDDKEVGRKFADLLLERRAAGIEVNLMYDSVGSLKTPREYFDRLRDGGIHVVEFNAVKQLATRRPWKLNHRDHRKLLIVDGRTAFLGGINIDSVYATGPSSGGGSSGGGSSGVGSSGGSKKELLERGWRDTDVQIEGPVVADFQKLFFTTWEKQHGPALDHAKYFPPLAPRGHEIVRAIGSTPDDPYSTTYLTLIAAITNAEQEVFITNAYFVPDPQLVNALVDAARRGVDVRLVLPSTTDSRSAAYAAHSHYMQLLEGGVKIYERKAALLHAKTAVIDGVWSCVGSSNLDWRSAIDNDELNAVILSKEFAQAMLGAYALDQAASDEITLDRWRHRSVGERAKEMVFRLCGRLL